MGVISGSKMGIVVRSEAFNLFAGIRMFRCTRSSWHGALFFCFSKAFHLILSSLRPALPFHANLPRDVSNFCSAYIVYRRSGHRIPTSDNLIFQRRVSPLFQDFMDHLSFGALQGAERTDI